LEEKFLTARLPNGMMLLGQQMKHVWSAAMTLMVPAGASYDPEGAEGAAAVACEWCFRGAGGKDTRQLNDALDSLGCQHRQFVHGEHLVFTAAQLGRNLPDVLGIYADLLRRPQLTDEAFGPCRELVAQDLASLEDQPAKKCNVVLRERFYPHPLGRCVYGRAESLQDLTPQTVRRHVAERFVPEGTILAVAGDVDWNGFLDLAGRYFGDWSGRKVPAVPIRPPAGGVTHIRKDSAQTHIALAHRSVTIDSDHYYAARAAEMVLSGGMSSRLFTEVREKLGLAYHVSSHYESLKDHAGIFTYAGTTPPKAQQTFDVTVAELRRLGERIEPSELERARTQLKSAMIMRAESTEARANSMAGDWYHLRRLRSLRELADAIDSISEQQVRAYLRDCPAKDFTILVVGPEPLETAGLDD